MNWQSLQTKLDGGACVGRGQTMLNTAVAVLLHSQRPLLIAQAATSVLVRRAGVCNEGVIKTYQGLRRNILLKSPLKD